MILILRVREKDVDVLKTHDIIWPSASIPHLDYFSIIIDFTVVWEKRTVLRSPEDEEKHRWYLEGEGDELLSPIYSNHYGVQTGLQG